MSIAISSFQKRMHPTDYCDCSPHLPSVCSIQDKRGAGVQDFRRPLSSCSHWVQFLTVVTLQFTNMFVENLRLIERNGLPGASEHHFHVSGSECILNIMVSKAYTYTPCNHHGYVEGMTLLEDPEMFAPKGILQGPFWAFVAANKNYAG